MARQLVYSKFQTRELIAEGEYKEYRYVVINFGTNPCCYVNLDSDHKYAGHHYNSIPIECHGGLSYSESWLRTSSSTVYEDGGWWIGWDYGHPGDYQPHIPDTQLAKRWTTEELIEECKNVIDQLCES